METAQANFVLPQSLLTEFRSLVPKGRQSEFVARALENELRRIRFQKAVSESFGAWTRQPHPEFKRGTEIYVRALRKSSRADRISR